MTTSNFLIDFLVCIKAGKLLFLLQMAYDFNFLVNENETEDEINLFCKSEKNTSFFDIVKMQTFDFGCPHISA